MGRVVPVIRRSKVDRPLTEAEQELIRTLRDMLTTRLEVAGLDAALHDFEKRLDAGAIIEQ